MTLPRRILLVLCVVALACAALVAALYGIENWRGAHAWAVCQRDLQARGERLDTAAFIPPPIPDDENLAMAPLFVRMYDYQVDPVTKLLTFHRTQAKNDFRDEVCTMPRGRAMSGIASPVSAGDWSTGRALNLVAWQQYYRRRPDFPHSPQPQTPAEDVLLALTKYDPILDELAQAAAARARTRFPINWTEPQPSMIALPHYNALQCMTGTLKLRATADVALGHDGAAMRDLALARRLTDISGADPLLIAQLVSITQAGQMMQPIWDGLKARLWSRPELEQIKTGLRDVDYLAGYRQAMRCERATFMCETADYFKKHGGTFATIRAIQTMLPADHDLSTKFYGGIVDLAPGGWYDQNKAIGCRVFQEMIDLCDPVAHRVSLAKMSANEVALEQMPVNPYTMLVKLGAPVFTSVIVRAARIQADVDHATVACALEQFYLDHQAYPTQLGELTPSYLDRVPMDPIDGALTRYRRTPDERYLLYSVGENERDDGGLIAWQKEGTSRDNSQGDWVWQYEPLQPPANIQRSK